MADLDAPAAASAAAGRIIDWIIGAGLGGHDQAGLTAGYCERLSAAGVPLWRASIGSDTLHPLIDALGYRWHAEGGVREESFARYTTPEGAAAWLQSPWYQMISRGEAGMRRRLAAGEGVDAFKLLADLAAAGGTDYWARIVRFDDRISLGDSRGLASSWTTRRPDGFAARDLALIEATLPAFALAYHAPLAIDTARTLLETYLGRDAARHVLHGEIARGKVSTLNTVLWFSDLTDFTRIADTLPRDRLLDLLNAYADCLVAVIHEHGGEVLKFMGDGILAVIGGPQEAACQRALDAAVAARVAVADLNSQRRTAGLPVTDVTLALHLGEVHYGNVGSRQRLDFTVVGPAVNEASRIEALSRSLDQQVLVSAAFAQACGPARDRLVSVGRYALRGVERPQELFTLDASADADGAPPGAP